MRALKRIAAVLFPCGALALASCDQFTGAGNREAQFMARRVEALEKKVGELEGEVNRLRAGLPGPVDGGGGSGLSSGAPGPAADSAIVSPGAVAISNRTAESLKSDVDRANILLLKAKQMESASREELPQLISSLGIVAPEVDELEAQIRRLEADRLRLTEQGGISSPEAVEAKGELEKLRFRLELVCEGVRQRVLEDGREASARLLAAPEDAAEKTQIPLDPVTP